VAVVVLLGSLGKRRGGFAARWASIIVPSIIDPSIILTDRGLQ
jgi:hypothetical protein